MTMDSAPATATATATATRLAVLAAGGGEGASTLTRVLAAAFTDAGHAVTVLSRADDPIPFAAPSSLPSVVVVDAGPHGFDGTVREDDVVVLVCAGNTLSIQRALHLLAEADERGRRVTALVICPRTPAEARRGRIRIEHAARLDQRVVVLPHDPVLRGGRVGIDEVSADTRAAMDRLRTILTG